MELIIQQIHKRESRLQFFALRSETIISAISLQTYAYRVLLTHTHPVAYFEIFIFVILVRIHITIPYDRKSSTQLTKTSKNSANLLSATNAI